MERYVEHYQFDPSNWVTTTVHFLDGRAIEWWNRLHRLGTCPTVWIEFKQILNREFKPLFANQIAGGDRFAILKQGNLSVQGYVHQLQNILLEATDIAKPEAIDHFVRNLKPVLYAKVRGSRPTSLDDTFKAAFDEEMYLLPPGITSTVLSASLISSFVPQMVDDSMDLSVLKHSLFCEWCKRKGHSINDCRTKAYAIQQFEKQHLQQQPQQTKYHLQYTPREKRCKMRYKLQPF
ncbi:hypothetical protein INT46_001312 [Mucor plumbeus]|uniref:Retrotransposon gag domain-containing protein n=1 Tax=Mucor plumbeus TaxID=97098 RepID=A0A8H7QES6_9FUNG|nr:hypothetical protein INT46_001312 [Mucor plumbeus]